MNITKKHIFWFISFIYSLIVSIARPDVPNTFYTIIVATFGAWVLFGGIVYVCTHIGDKKKDPIRDIIAIGVSSALFGLIMFALIIEKMTNGTGELTIGQERLVEGVFLAVLLLIFSKLINAGTPKEFKDGKIGHCSICGKGFGTGWSSVKKALMWWFCSKERTMACPECRAERKKRKKEFKQTLETALKDEYLDKEQEIQLLKSLAEVHLEQLLIDSQKDWDYVRRLTGYKTGNLVPMTLANIALKDNEKLLFTTPVSLHKVRTQVKYRGRSAGFRFQLTDDISYSTGVFEAEPIREQYLNLEGKGELYLTDQRVIFNGCRNITYKWKDVFQVISFPPDGVSFTAENKNLYLLKTADQKALREVFICSEALLGSKVRE